MKTAAPPIHLAGSRLSEPRHVCAFFHRADEEYRVLLPFIKEGFECGDRDRLDGRRAERAVRTSGQHRNIPS
jgi:hypothetical protein